MIPSNRRILQEYSVAVGSTVLALLVRAALDPILGNHLPYDTFFVAVVAATWYGGLGASLAAVALGGLAADWFFTAPRQSFAVVGLTNQVGFATYFFVALTIVSLGHLMRQARQRADAVTEGLRREVSERRQAEETLRRSETLYRAIGESIDYGVWVCTPDGRNTYASDSFLNLLGITQEQCSNFGWGDALHPDDAERTIVAWKECIRTSGTWDMEHRFRGVDGQWHHILARGVPVKDERGQVMCWAGINLDMSRLKRSEEDLRESEARVRTLADNMSQLAWMVNEAGEAEWFNQRWFDYTGTDFAQMRGRGWRQVHHPDHVERVVSSWRRAYAAHELWEETFPLRGRDGAYRWFLTRAVPIRDAAGAVVRWFGTNTDITEIRNAEAALRKSEERYRTLYESIDEGFCVIEVLFDEHRRAVDHVFLEVNPSFEKQTGIQSAQGRRMREIAPNHEAHWFELYGTIVVTGESRRFEYPAVELQRWYEGYAYRIGEAHERKVAILFKDITERKQAEAQLRRLNNELEVRVIERTEQLTQSHQRLRAMATELNLAEQRERKRMAGELHDHLAQLLVLGRLKLSQAKLQPGLPSKSSALIAETEEVLNDSLRYTRTLVADLSPPVLHDFGLAAALKWLADGMQRQGLTVHTSAEISGSVKLPDEQATLLFQSVRELLINASKHAQTETARVSLRHGPDELRIIVRDEGKGFDVTALDSREAGTSALSSKFGLFSIRERMTALGGRLELESAPGKGTVATLILPRAGAELKALGAAGHPVRRAEESALALAERSPQQRAPSSTGIRVLLVDDHAMVRQGLRSVLDSYADIEVVGEAANGEEAVKMAERLNPTVVVMDINMPGKNGIEATAEVKARFPQTIVIGISVQPNKEARDAMVKAGAATLLTKEAAVDDLYRTIQDALLGAASKT